MEGHIKYSKGVCWIGDCRIPFVDDNDKSKSVPGGKVSYTDESWGQQAGLEKILQDKRDPNQQGRFTPNLLVCDDMLNDGSITSKGKMKLHRMSGWGDTQEIKKDAVEYQGDKGTNSRYYDLDLWFDKMLEKL